MKNKIKTLLLAAAIMLPSVAYAQIENDSPLTSKQNRRASMVGNGMSSGRKGEEKKPAKVRPVATKSRSEKADAFKVNVDSVELRVQSRSFPDLKGCDHQYYLHVVKKHGWYVGIGKPLTEEHIKHLPCYYKLSRRGKTGPWAYMQAMNGYGKLTTSHTMIPYVDYSGDGAGDWEDKVNSVCQWEIVGNNGVVLQECAYDEDGELVYSFYPTTISSNETIGHFTDRYGVETTLRDNEKSGVSYIKTTFDSLGYECRYDFFDHNGYYERNNGGERFVTIVEHDKAGNVVKNVSCDPYGKPILDDYGNSGWVSTFDEYGNTIYNINLDEDGDPMRMPGRRTSRTYVLKKNEYDKWGRLVRESFYDENADPDTISTGVHAIVREYNDRGGMTLYREEGLEGPHNDSSGCCYSVRDFDSNGNRTLFARYTADGLLVNGSDGDCMSMYRFRGDERIETRYYNTTNGTDTVCNFRLVTENGVTTGVNYEKQWIYQRKRDKWGNQTEYAIYDLQMKPIMEDGYHKNLTEYERGNKRMVMRDYYLDTEGRLADMSNPDFTRNYSCNVETVDSVNHVKIFEKYDKDMHLIEKYAYKYNDDFSSTLEYWSYDNTGNRGRTMREDALFYGLRYVRNHNGSIVSLQAFNEYDEPSYLITGEWTNASAYSTDIKQDPYYYDERGDSISSAREFRSEHCKAFCVEVTDSVGLANGLRSGDLLLQYGEWRYCESRNWNSLAENRLTVATVNNARREKKVLLMRHDAESKTSRVVELTLGKGTPEELGFVFHQLIMTRKEEKDYDAVCANYLKEKDLQLSDYKLSGFDYEQKREICVVKPYVIDFKHEDYSKRGMTEKAVVVGAKTIKDGLSCLYTLDESSNVFDAMLQTDRDSLVLYYTADGLTLKEIGSTSNRLDASFSLVYGPATLYEDVNELATVVRQQYEQSSEPKLTRDTRKRSPKAVADALRSRLPDNIDKLSTGSLLSGYVTTKDAREKSNFLYVSSDTSEWDFDKQIALFDIVGNIDATGYNVLTDEDDNVLYYKTNGEWVTEMLLVDDDDNVLYIDHCKAKIEEEDAFISGIVKLYNDLKDE